MGHHVSQPLTIVCNCLDDIRRFLKTCSYVRDQAQFGRADYWIPPHEFERRRRGDCEDFALWTWRQLMHLGYSTRFVCGVSGRYGAGHAWVTFERDGRTFIVESLAAWHGETFPRLSTLRYSPKLSVSWDGRKFTYFEHQAVDRISMLEIMPHLSEWTRFWLRSRPIVWARGVRRLWRDAQR